MKKVIVIIALFAIFVITFTATMINIKKIDNLTIKNNTNISTASNVESSDNNLEIKSDEKTLDLYKLYRDNNISIFEYIEDNDDYYAKIPQIKGLKNKNIENKVNDGIVLKSKEFMDNIISKYDSYNEKVEFDYNTYEIGNFSNVVSFSLSGRVSTDHYCLGLNYELVNGNEITLKDFFTEETVLNDIYRIALYKEYERTLLTDMYWYYDDLHYDIKNNAWMANYFPDSNESEQQEGLVEYFPSINEYDIAKKLERFNKIQNFYFLKSMIVMWDDYNSYSWNRRLFIEEFADKVTIYDKYVTEDSIFENDDEKLFVACCARSVYVLPNRKIKFNSDKVFSDSIYLTEEDCRYGVAKDLQREQIKILNQQIDDTIKEYLNKNDNKFYMLFMNPKISIPLYKQESYYSFLVTSRNLRVLSCSLENKNKLLDEVFGIYRYYNLGMYNGVHSVLNDSIRLTDNSTSVFDSNEYVNTFYSGQKYLNIISKQEYKDISDLFKPDVDYEAIIIDKLKSKLRNVTQLSIEKIEIDDYYFVIYTYGDKYAKYLEIADVLEYCTIDKIPYIYSIVYRDNLYETLSNYSDRELNFAYNYVFARHGHDFKNKELKDYFSLFDWYEPIPGKVVTMDDLKDDERNYVQIVSKVINDRKF